MQYQVTQKRAAISNAIEQVSCDGNKTKSKNCAGHYYKYKVTKVYIVNNKCIHVFK